MTRSDLCPTLPLAIIAPPKPDPFSFSKTQHRHFNLAMMIDNSNLEPWKHDKMSYVSFSRPESIGIVLNRRIALAGYDWLQTCLGPLPYAARLKASCRSPKWAAAERPRQVSILLCQDGCSARLHLDQIISQSFTQDTANNIIVLHRSRTIAFNY